MIAVFSIHFSLLSFIKLKKYFAQNINDLPRPVTDYADRNRLDRTRHFSKLKLCPALSGNSWDYILFYSYIKYFWFNFPCDRSPPLWGAFVPIYVCLNKKKWSDWRPLLQHRGRLVKSIWERFLSVRSGSQFSVSLVTDHTNNIMRVETVALWI